MALTQVSTGGIKDGQVQTADLADGQVTVGKLHADALDHTYTLGADGSNHYTFTGEGLTGAVNDPTLYLTRGKTYRFVNGNSAGAHPFRIQTTVNGSAGTEYNTGVTNNGGAGGSTIVFEVPHAAPDVLYYQCTSHGSMGGILYVTGALADGTVTTAKLASSVSSAIAANTAKDLTALNASNLTSGTVPDARIGASSVTQHVTAFDDNKIINDISALALKLNALQNATRYNTNSTYVDTYQDANGITSLTNVQRDTTGEYISSIISNTVSYDFNTAGTHGQPQLFGLITQNNFRRSAYWTNDQVRSYNSGSQSSYGMTVVDFAFDLSGDFTHYSWWKQASNGSSHTGAYQTYGAVISPLTTITSGKAPTLSGSSVFDITSTTQATLQSQNSGYGVYIINQGSVILQNTFSSAAYTHLDVGNMGSTANYGTSNYTKDYTSVSTADGYMHSFYENTGTAYYGVKFVYDKSANTLVLGYIANNTGSFSSSSKTTITNLPTTGRIFLFGGQADGTTSADRYFGLRNDQGVNSSGTFIDLTTSATGSYVSNAVTASSSTSKMGVVITYIDNAGTATLNTDLKVSVSADNGSNFTQVTLVAQPDFSTGVKMAVANDVTVTAGTQLKYKVEFANQASGSKETRVTGVSMQY